MLTKGVIDGVLLPYEIMPAFKIHELVHNHITLSGRQPRVGTSVFSVLMNKKRYDSLDASLKKAIDDNSGRHIAKWAGETWEEVEKPGMAMAQKAGNKFVSIPQSEVAKIVVAVQPEIDKFLAELSKPGFDAKAAYADAQKMVAKYSK
jgi:TRAP-type C4-dicarboxylate transport system substrate-binding protein